MAQPVGIGPDTGPRCPDTSQPKRSLHEYEVPGELRKGEEEKG